MDVIHADGDISKTTKSATSGWFAIATRRGITTKIKHQEKDMSFARQQHKTPVVFPELAGAAYVGGQSFVWADKQGDSLLFTFTAIYKHYFWVGVHPNWVVPVYVSV